jgi:acylphosphatase
MKKCVKIMLEGTFPVDYMHKVVLQQARKIGIGGICQMIEGQGVRIIASGTAEQIDDLIDVLYKKSTQKVATGFSIESFLNEKDFRGVFRVIE